MLAFCVIVINIWLLSSSGAQQNQVCSGRYQEYNECGEYYCNPRCPLPIDRFLHPGPVCLPRKPPNCSPGCMCTQGYVNDTTTGNCIQEKYCRQLGDPNTHFDECGAACQPTCKCPHLRRRGSTCGCSFRCEPGYVCNGGYVKNSTGWCVKRQCCH